MELQPGKTIYDERTFVCNDYPGCLYEIQGRCVYNVARIQSRVSRACYEELRQDEIECELDALDAYR